MAARSDRRRQVPKERRQGAGLHPRHLPLRRRQVRRSKAFDDRLIAVDEFHHVSANPDNKLGAHLGALHRPRQGASRGDDRFLLSGAMPRPYCRPRTRRSSTRSPTPTTSSSTATNTSSRSTSAISSIPAPMPTTSSRCSTRTEKTIIHIPNVNSRESTKDKHPRGRAHHRGAG
jgi:hypothetical protein